MDSDFKKFSGNTAKCACLRNAFNNQEILKNKRVRAEGIQGLKRKAEALEAEIAELEKNKDLYAKEIKKRREILSCIKSTLQSNAK